MIGGFCKSAQLCKGREGTHIDKVINLAAELGTRIAGRKVLLALDTRQPLQVHQETRGRLTVQSIDAIGIQSEVSSKLC